MLGLLMASSLAIDECGVDASSLLRRKLDRQGENLANTAQRAVQSAGPAQGSDPQE
jgi:hypothetical protein